MDPLNSINILDYGGNIFMTSGGLGDKPMFLQFVDQLNVNDLGLRLHQK